MAKPAIDGPDANIKASFQNTLYTCLDTGLKLLHPFMPFITEELWQRLPRRPGDSTVSICIAQFPLPTKEFEDNQADQEFEQLFSIVKASRSLMSDYNVLNNATCICYLVLIRSVYA